MRRKSLIVITIIIIMLLLAAEIYIIRKASAYEPKIKVCFAVQSIRKDVEITEEMIEFREVNLSYAHRLAIRDAKDIIGKYAAHNIEKDEMILSTRLNEKRTLGAEVQNPSNRLVTIEFSAGQANGWWLNPGQYVDIIFIPDRSLEQTEREPGIKRFSNIRIAALIGENGEFIDRETNKGIPRYISFEVEKGLDEELAYCSLRGKMEISAIP